MVTLHLYMVELLMCEPDASLISTVVLSETVP